MPRLLPRNYMSFLSTMDIVLSPLIIDEFTKGKSWIKPLEAAFMGTIWVGSNQRDYLLLNQLTDTGYISDDTEWFSTIKT